MKIVIITGSPHKKGTSALLAEKFIKGAAEKGHSVFRFDAAFEDVYPCTACNKCRSSMADPCVFDDDMGKLYPQLLEADLIAFVSPLYYYSVSAQLKLVIDRFYPINSKITGNKKAVLMMTAEAKGEEAMSGAIKSYLEAIKYLKWIDCGMVLAGGCGVREEIENSNFPEKAYQLGKSL